ncbi:MAG: hypothetical protein KDK89_03765 [Alphaproteobacteria bacterium]|nr:hypothetical protein [Alphaproteobacteria bacterium]
MRAHRFTCLAAAASRRFLANKAGNMSVVTALIVIPLIAAAGLAIDYGRTSRVKDKLQALADTAALAAASAANLTGDAEAKRGEREQIASSYLATALAGATDMTVAGTPEVKADDTSITVKIDARVEGSLVALATTGKKSGAETSESGGGDQDGKSGSDSINLSVSAKARWDGSRNYVCLLALNPSAANALSVQGTADIKAEKCAVQVNSTSSNALYQNGNATVKASSICVKGNYAGSNLTPTPKTNCARFEDPLAAKFAADYATAYGTAVTRYSHKSALTFAKGTTGLQPGMYRGGMRVDNGVTLNLAPGTYFIEDGALEIRGGGVVNGTGVTIVFTGNQNSILFVIANGGLNIKAPASGLFAGLAIAQHPMVLPSVKYSNTVIGGGQLNLEGIIYLPKQNFYVTGNGLGTTTDLSTTAKQFSIVADTITIQGNGQVNVGQAADFDAAGLPTLPTINAGASQVSLVE